jgi:hypothetical protein
VNYGLNNSSEKDQGRTSKMDTARNRREPRGEWMRMRSRREPSLYTASIARKLIIRISIANALVDR